MELKIRVRWGDGGKRNFGKWFSDMRQLSAENEKGRGGGAADSQSEQQGECDRQQEIDVKRTNVC